MGFWELLVILAIVMLFFGARRLPAIGEGLGKAIRGFRDAVRSGPPPPPPSPGTGPTPGGGEER